jgi:hypothetical protein
MTALQQIIKEAKILRKKNPKIEWKKAVAQASAIYASKHKGKSPVGKKHKKVGKVTLKKSNLFKGDERYIIMNDGHKHLEGKPFFKQTAKDVASALRKVKAKRKKAAKKVGTIKRKVVRKKAAKKRKPSERTVLKSIKHAVKVQKSHMGNIGSVNKEALKRYENNLNQIFNIEKHLRAMTNMSKDKGYNLENRKQFKLNASAYKKYLSELKTHARELKKHI